MTTQTNEKPQTEKTANMPTMVVKQRVGFGKKATYERLGVAWLNDDGSIYVKPYGTQIISGGFTLYPLETGDDAAE